MSGPQRPADNDQPIPALAKAIPNRCTVAAVAALARSGKRQHRQQPAGFVGHVFYARVHLILRFENECRKLE
jgi:hypothetical protein